MQQTRMKPRRRAVIMVGVIVCLIVMTLMFGAIVRGLIADGRRSRSLERSLQSMWLAESGLERAIARMAADPTYRGEAWDPSAISPDRGARGTVEIKVEPATGRQNAFRVTATARFPAFRQWSVVQTRELVILASRIGERQ